MISNPTRTRCEGGSFPTATRRITLPYDLDIDHKAECAMRAALEDALCMTDSFYGPIVKIDYDYKAFAEHLLDGLGRRGFVLREAID